MSPIAKTAVFIIAAAVLAGLAWFTQPVAPDIERLSDQGEPFYPDFTDPLEATSLEVIEFDAQSGSAVPFKVQFADGTWTIPSHYDYPADGQDRLARTASAVMDLKRDIIQSDRAQDHESLGVIDPLDDSATALTGRGKRVTLRDKSGAVLADYIIGKPVPGKEGYRYVRLPDKKRTYAVNVDVDLSTKFQDWINASLLDVRANQVQEVSVNDYSIDESTGSVDRVGSATVQRSAMADNVWTSPDLPEGQTVNTERIQKMLSALAQLKITGVRPKPEALSANLRRQQGIQVDRPTALSLQSKGFFFAQDGRLLSNEGEISIGARNGVRYILRFGEVLFGEGASVSAGTDDDAPSADDAAGPENRYVFITATFDESLLGPKPQPPVAEGDVADGASEPANEDTNGQDSGEANGASDDDADSPAMKQYQQALERWQEQAEQGREKAQQLSERFAPWYYVFSAGDFENLRPSVDELFKPVSAGNGVNETSSSGS